MKRFLIQCLHFGVLFAVVNLAISSFYAKIAMKNSLLSRTQVQFDESARHVKYLFCGDSHTKRAINPQLLQDSFNFSSQGESYLKTFYKIRKVIRRYPSIDYIILPVDLHSFSPFRTYRFGDDTYWIKYIDYFEVARETRQAGYITKWIKGRFFGYIGEKENLVNGVFSLGNTEQKPLLSGYMPADSDFSTLSSTQKTEEVQTKVDWHFSDRECLDAVLLRYLEMTLQLCKQHNVQVIFVAYPVSEPYYNAVAAICPINRIDAEFRAITAEYPNVIGMLNYRTLFFKHEEYFMDPDHLNTVGAAKFTTMIREELNKMGLRI